MFDVVTDIPQREEIKIFVGTVADRMSIAVAPSTGRFAPVVEAPAMVKPGDVIGHITGGNGRADEVYAPVGATLKELLARPGQLVALGQGLAYLERVAPAGREGMQHESR
ncbi:MAG: hypothetical protein ACR2HR_07315 [Euzebya sp.]